MPCSIRKSNRMGLFGNFEYFPRISKFQMLQSIALIQTKNKMNDLHYGRFLWETEASIIMRCDYIDITVTGEGKLVIVVENPPDPVLFVLFFFLFPSLQGFSTMTVLTAANHSLRFEITRFDSRLIVRKNYSL